VGDRWRKSPGGKSVKIYGSRWGKERGNLHVRPAESLFEVQPCRHHKRMRRLCRILRESTQGSSIVYVGRRKDADRIVCGLDDNGCSSVAYHAGMDSESRRKAQELWLSGKNRRLLPPRPSGWESTSRMSAPSFIISIPASLESYYQEAGRAGCDGKPARCVVLYSGNAVSLAHFFIRNRYPSPQQVAQVFSRISPAGTAVEELRSGADLTGEQLNTMLWPLTQQRKIRRKEDGLLRRKRNDPGRIGLSAIHARRK